MTTKSDYKKFYFLHINKTTSKTLGVRMMKQLYNILETNGVQAKSINASHGDHNYWRDFDEDTFVFSTVRQPFYFAISQFCHFVNYGVDGKRTHSNGRDRECPFFTTDKFRTWTTEYMVPNYQAKIISGWGCKYIDEQINENYLLENLKRINLLVKTENIQNNENKIRNMILQQLGIEHEFVHYPTDYENVFMPFGDFSKQMNPLIEKNPDCVKIINTKNKYDEMVYASAMSIF